MIPRKRPRNPSTAAESAEERPLKVVKPVSHHECLLSTSMPNPGASASATELPFMSRSKDSTQLISHVTPTGLLDMPDDILCRIFARFEPAPDLCRLMTVCRRFAQVACSPELWRYVKAVDPVPRRVEDSEDDGLYRHISYELIEVISQSIQKRSNTTTRQRQRERNGIKLAVDVITSRAGSQLVSLDLDDCYPDFHLDHQMSDVDLEIISTRCSESLQTLRLSPSRFVTHRGLLDFAKSCPQLQTLHMTGCRHVTDKTLSAIVRACPTLLDISVSRCDKFRGIRLHEGLHPIRNTLKRIDISVTFVTSIELSKFMCTYPALEEIKADGCRSLGARGRREPPSGDTLGFPSLRSLNLNKTVFVSAASLKDICSRSAKLRFLSLSELNEKILHLEQVFEVTWPPLKYLGLAGQPITDAMWQQIFEKLGASLVQCDLSKNMWLTGKLQVFGNDSFAELEELNVRWTGFTDSTVKELMDLAPKLKFLDLSGCRGVERKKRRNPRAFQECMSATEASPGS